MDVKLENLIEKIKKEGVEDAQRKADEILKKAEKEAASIVEDARKEAEKIQKEAERKIGQFQKNSELALQQANRDAQLLLKEKLMAMFDRVFKREVSGTLTHDFVKELILNIVKTWAKKSEVEIEVNEKDKKKLEKLMFEGISKDLKDAILVKPSPDMEHGFRVGMKGEDVYYDFSDESIAEMLKGFLNPRLNDILDGKNG